MGLLKWFAAQLWWEMLDIVEIMRVEGGEDGGEEQENIWLPKRVYLHFFECSAGHIGEKTV